MLAAQPSAKNNAPSTAGRPANRGVRSEHAGEEETTEGRMESTWLAGMKGLAAVILGRLGKGQRRAGGWDEVGGET